MAHDLQCCIPTKSWTSDPIFIKLIFLKVDDIYKYQVSKVFNGTNPIQFHNWLNHDKYGQL